MKKEVEIKVVQKQLANLQTELYSIFIKEKTLGNKI